MALAGHSSRKKVFFTVLWACAVLAAVAVTGEAAVRLFLEPPAGGPALNLVQPDAGFRFSLNPAHPEISSQGLRDREYEVPGPPGVFRILVLGDSVTYGLFVEAAQAYPERLEEILGQGGRVEVLNAGVNGYTPYNELHFYLERGRSFRPDLVLTAFCLNDIVDPLLHWGDRDGRFHLPEEAFPDPARSRRLERGRKGLSGFLEKHSALFRFLWRRWELWRKRTYRYEEAGGNRLPVYAADEDTVSIRTLASDGSSEGEWLASVYRELRDAVKKDGAEFALVFFPLAYQLEEGYPFKPQERLMEFCVREDIPCLDLLPVFRTHAGEKIFLGRHRYHPRDVWHLTERGHFLAARAIADFLEESSLLPGKEKGGQSGNE